MVFGMKRITFEDRLIIEREIAKGNGCQKIAKLIGKCKSTISYEKKKFKYHYPGEPYDATRAHDLLLYNDKDVNQLMIERLLALQKEVESLKQIIDIIMSIIKQGK